MINNDITEKEKEQKEPNYAGITSIAGAILLVTVIAYVVNFSSNGLSGDPEEWSQFGDYIGGTLGASFGFITLMALLYTIKLQIEQLNLSREELAATREELKRSADAQTDAQIALHEQLKTMKLQQFDSIFFAVLEKMHKQQDMFIEKKYVTDDIYVNNIEYRQTFDLKEFLSNLETHKLKTNTHQFNKELKRFASFLVITYQLLKLIATKTPDSTFHDEEDHDYDALPPSNTEIMYAHIARSIMTDEILLLLALNCTDIFPIGQETSNYSFKELIERYSIFEHLDIHLLVHFRHTLSQYENSAF
ncbi:putative phage abortive infection protein, partial [Laribacter hongkongensis]|uniref:putative phage abortive infection protein n=1 Tax=Laribacter hongkongensis TaxID=168471 RepID=UPI001EFC6290